MRLPSIALIVTSAQAAARRFPLVIGASLVASYAALVLVHHKGDDSPYVRLLVAATLAFPLLFALTLLAERRARTAGAGWGMLAIGVVVLVAFWAAWPGWTTRIQAERYVQLSAAFHFMVAFLPYVGYDEPKGFWQYNRVLFIRFLTAALYSSVLYAGLAIALLALDKLLGVHVSSESYARLWIIIAFVFNTWFFVGGVPRDLTALQTLDDYPEGLRIFSQYVLVPIVAIYLAILTLYLAKVVITRQWPSGWIGYLVSSVATVGILSWLLVQPLEERAEYAWVKGFTRGFYVLLMPAIVMLWLSIWKRVQQYGLTEPRYFLIVLSVWLASVAVYYTVARSRSIKLIPATLCAIALLTFAGPWGAYSVSQASQRGRLQAVLARNELLANGVLRRATHDVPFEDRKDMSAGFRYLFETYGEHSVQSWLSDSLKHALGQSHGTGPRGWGEADARAVMTALNVPYVSAWEGRSTGQYFSYYANAGPEPIPIAGYAVAIRISLWALRDSLRIAERTVVRLAADSMTLRLERNGTLLLAIPLQRVVDSAAAYQRSQPSGALPAAVLRVEAENGGARALASFTQLTGVRRPEGNRLTSFEGELFVRVP